VTSPTKKVKSKISHIFH